jgi:hypothetical protein
MTLRDRLLPWSAFVLGGAGWFVGQQWGSIRVNDGCLTALPWQTAVLALLGLLMGILGAALSLRSVGATQPPATNFIARISLASDGVFAVAIIFHVTAVLLIPRCFS